MAAEHQQQHEEVVEEEDHETWKKCNSKKNELPRVRIPINNIYELPRTTSGRSAAATAADLPISICTK